MLTEEEFLKHVYHTRLHVVIPALNRAKIEKSNFFNKKGRFDEIKLDTHLKKLYQVYKNKHS